MGCDQLEETDGGTLPPTEAPHQCSLAMRTELMLTCAILMTLSFLFFFSTHTSYPFQAITGILGIKGWWLKGFHAVHTLMWACLGVVGVQLERNATLRTSCSINKD